VHTHASPTDPLPPALVPLRPDVFVAGRKFPVPAVDFGGLTEALAQIKSKAQTAGRYFGASGGKGYHIVLKTNDTFDIYKVKKLFRAPEDCRKAKKEKNWGTWSIDSGASGEQLIGNYAFPANGLIFTEDHAWVDGQINTARLTIAAGRFPANAKSYRHIMVNKNLLYTNHDGQDVLGLIAQGNVNVGLVSNDTLTVEAAVVAQNGRVGRFYYKPASGNKNNCAPYETRQEFSLNGMIGTNQGYGFAFTDGTGYQKRNITYDANLLYNPPPSFPVISGQYQQISWKLLK
jgi:hypothetical protein